MKSASSEKRFLTCLLTMIAGILWIPSLILPPEGAVRNGDSLPIILPWLVLLGVIFFTCGLMNRSKKKNISSGHRIVWPDLFAVALLVWTGLSWWTLAITDSGNRLYAANMVWTFALPIVVYFVVRLTRAFGRPPFEAILLAGLFGAAIFETGLSLYSYYVTDPATRVAFRTDPERLLRENGLDFEKGSPEYLLMEKRVLTSSEPFGSYGMANTLAGFLVPTLILLTGGLFSRQLSRQKIPILLSVIYLLPIWGVLILTKSRAGYLAFFAGVIGTLAVILFGRSQELKKSPIGFKLGWRFLIGIVSILLFFILCLGVAFRLGYLDAEVFSEAKKSLGYRLDYWLATSGMIVDYPIFGVGPGNFQAIYPQFILPTAGETIADPHNFVFELAAVFGIPATILFLAFVVSLIPTAFRKRAMNIETPSLTMKGAFVLCLSGYLLFMVLNFLTSAPTDIHFLIGFFLPFLILTVPTAGIVMNPNSISSPLIWVVLAASLLNLCAAGGIAFPAVALPIWGLAGILVNRKLNEPNITGHSFQAGPMSSRLYFIGAGIIALLIPTFYFTAFLPHQTEAEVLLFHSEETPITAFSRLEKVANGPGRDSIPIHQTLFSSAITIEAQWPSEVNKERYRQAKERLFAVAPTSAAVRSSVGKAEMELYKKTGRHEFLNATIESFAEASRLFPTDAVAHAQLGLALYDAKRPSEAKSELTEALRLNEITPHEDRKIPAPLLQRIKEIIP